MYFAEDSESEDDSPSRYATPPQSAASNAYNFPEKEGETGYDSDGSDEWAYGASDGLTFKDDFKYKFLPLYSGVGEDSLADAFESFDDKFFSNVMTCFEDEAWTRDIDKTELAMLKRIIDREARLRPIMFRHEQRGEQIGGAGSRKGTGAGSDEEDDENDESILFDASFEEAEVARLSPVKDNSPTPERINTSGDTRSSATQTEEMLGHESQDPPTSAASFHTANDLGDGGDDAHPMQEKPGAEASSSKSRYPAWLSPVSPAPHSPSTFYTASPHAETINSPLSKLSIAKQNDDTDSYNDESDEDRYADGDSDPGSPTTRQRSVSAYPALYATDAPATSNDTYDDQNENDEYDDNYEDDSYDPYAEAYRAFQAPTSEEDWGRRTPPNESKVDPRSPYFDPHMRMMRRVARRCASNAALIATALQARRDELNSSTASEDAPVAPRIVKPQPRGASSAW